MLFGFIWFDCTVKGMWIRISKEQFIYNSDIYNEVTSVGYIAKTYDVDAIMAAQYDLQ